MTFEPTKLAGVFVVGCDVFADDRGFFARAWMPEEFRERGLETHIAQGSIASNRHRGTIRGLHFQNAPFAEVKLVRVTRGAIFDVVVDMRPASPTFRQWVGTELTSQSLRQMYIPVGCAHGYQTLSDDTEIFYFVSSPYTPSHHSGVRWNDPAFGIEWPLEPTEINARDRNYPDFNLSQER